MTDETTVDLDKARAARREVRGEPPKVILGGHTYYLPIELPLEVAFCLEEIESARGTGAVGKAIMKIVGIVLGDQMEAFVANDLSMDDLEAFFEGVLAKYGLTPGESSALDQSSGRTSKPSKPTSNPTTNGTFDKASTVPTP